MLTVLWNLKYLEYFYIITGINGVNFDKTKSKDYFVFSKISDSEYIITTTVLSWDYSRIMRYVRCIWNTINVWLNTRVLWKVIWFDN